MSDFPTKTLDTIKQSLLKEQIELEKDLKEMEEGDPATAASLAESSEPGTDSYIADTHTKAVLLESQLKNAQAGIKNALSKIQNGTYGQCEKCGRRIEEDRLLAMPTTTLCLTCSIKDSQTS